MAESPDPPDDDELEELLGILQDPPLEPR